MDAQTFESKYHINLGTTCLIDPIQPKAPLHYHFSDGYNYDVIKRHTPDRELRVIAQTLIYLNDDDPEIIEEVLNDLRALRQGLHNPYRVF